MIYKKIYDRMHKKAAGQLASFLSLGAYTLAAVFMAAAGGAGVLTGYTHRALTKPRKQDLKNVEKQYRVNRLKSDVNDYQVAVKQLQNKAEIEEPKKALRVF